MSDIEKELGPIIEEFNRTAEAEEAKKEREHTIARHEKLRH